MDLMNIRRGLMMAMAKGGINYVSGEFTIPDSGNTYTLQLGKSFSRYMFFISMTDESKQTVMGSGSNYSRTYEYYGTYPGPEIDGANEATCIYAARIAPSTDTRSTGTTNNSNCTNSSITLNTVDITTSGWAALVHGLTYKYLAVSLADI